MFISRSIFRSLFNPDPLPYDFEQWSKKPFTQRAKMICQAWALQGFGAPLAAAFFYIIKILAYILGWLFWCSFSEQLGNTSELNLWWFKIEALSKAIVWTILVEVIGLGGGSGPLTGRYVPPFGGILYFLRPGTIRMAFRPGKNDASDKRTFGDVLLYLLLLISLILVLLSPQTGIFIAFPVILLLLNGLRDRTIFLAARADIYLPMLLCITFAFGYPESLTASLKLLWFGIWFWAAFSKLTPNFTSVITVMLCNSPLLKAKLFNSLKAKLFNAYPEDLRPSKTANYIAHFGTIIEFSMPLLLLFAGANTQLLFIALSVLTAFHFFIFINFPMGVPMEWNVIMVYGGWVLFYIHPEVSIFAFGAVPIIIPLMLLFLLVLPITGHLFPRKVSFLLSMRYYAGTWAYNVWLFKGDKKDKLDQHITKTSKAPLKQAMMLYDETTSKSVISRIIAFRLMHLPGRMLNTLLPKAVSNLDEYNWADGELVAGELLGWNFGDGHLSHEPLLRSVQKRCNYESGELRVIMVESPSFFTQSIYWRIYDANDGLIEQGIGNTSDLKQQLPWQASLTQ
ncbi:MAG: hypothetical protein ACI959_000948 [Limisphaerales bacterium]|jgi:hypothetical protein